MLEDTFGLHLTKIRRGKNGRCEGNCKGKVRANRTNQGKLLRFGFFLLRGRANSRNFE
jgi:hypothetical protein